VKVVIVTKGEWSKLLEGLSPGHFLKLRKVLLSMLALTT
jgi:hypothetical protein